MRLKDQRLIANEAAALNAWQRWRAAVKMTVELASIVTDVSTSPSSPLYDGPRNTLDPLAAVEIQAAKDRATRRLAAATQIEAAVRAELLAALDAVATNKPARYVGDAD